MERNLNGMELERNGIKIKTKQMDDNYANDSIIEWSTSASFVAMACRREFFFFLLLVFSFFFFSFSSSRIATRATHYMIASSKTHRNAQPIC